VTKTYTARAVAAITQAARTEHDFAGWLARVLADAAGQLGGSDELIIGRPGSWEASFVDQLVKGTVGYSDEYLPGPVAGRKLTDAKARQIREACDWDEMTQREIAAQFGVSPSTVSDIATGRTWGWLK
jgi:Helix-turn-helix